MRLNNCTTEALSTLPRLIPILLCDFPFSSVTGERDFVNFGLNELAESILILVEFLSVAPRLRG